MTDAATGRALQRGGGRSGCASSGRPRTDHPRRSVSSIVAGNVFTLFNAIIGVFFVLILSLGLFADAVFGFIAILNSYIGIRQELKAKETLDEPGACWSRRGPRRSATARWPRCSPTRSCPATSSGSSRATSSSPTARSSRAAA